MSPTSNQRICLALPHIRKNVIVHRDERGIPYIKALNTHDLYFAQGFVTAADRLWQMDLFRRVANGELSEIFGASTLDDDKRHRIYGFHALADRLFRKAPIHVKRILSAYASGVNAFIRSCDPTSLPAEFICLRYRPTVWTASDSLAVSKLFAERLSTTLDIDLMRALLTDLPRHKVDALLPENSPLDVILVSKDFSKRGARTYKNRDLPQLTTAEVEAISSFLKAERSKSTGNDGGSNSWVVSGKRTATGKPILANDPHLPASSPSVWHVIHLGQRNSAVAGVAIPGLPGVMIGHNERVAWGITNLRPDVQDLYFETFKESGSPIYRTARGWRRARMRHEQIRVRQSLNSSSCKTVNFCIKTTQNGPILFELKSTALALRWTALDSNVIDLETFLAINQSKNWKEFLSALEGYCGPPQNFTYADTDGHIGYYSAGRIPIRKTGDGSVPYRGTTNNGEWVGFIPFRELPHLFDPPSGMIVTANNRLVGNQYPYHITHSWKEPYRARRIQNLLSAQTNLTADDMLLIQGDTYSYPDFIFCSELLKLAEPLIKRSAKWREIFQTFTRWEGYSDASSTVLPLLSGMRRMFRNLIVQNALGADRAALFEWSNEGTFIDRLIAERPQEWLPESFPSYESLILSCYNETQRNLRIRFGPNRTKWNWGKLAIVHFPHPLEKFEPVASRFKVPTSPQNSGGSSTTVNAGASVSMRFIADLSSWNNARICLPLGESGNLTSLHRLDQLDDWLNVRALAMPFTGREILQAARTTLVMRPASATKKINRMK